MIKAFILVHLWSLVVASGAWALQRDGAGQIGASFPSPIVWLTLIALSLLPGVLYLIPFEKAISFPTLEILELIPIQAYVSSTEGPAPINYLMIYIGLTIVFMSRTLWRWLRLQQLPLVPTDVPDVFTTNSQVPPITLSWPRRAIVVPNEFTIQPTLIRHERTHLHHYDAELTLLLLLLQDSMLRNPGICYLVRQWRLSIELRADYSATKGLSAAERKGYAVLLLSTQRPNHGDTGSMPCPTAQLGSTPHRNVKMRLTNILQNEPKARKRRWDAALLVTFIGAGVIGLMSTIAIATEKVMDAEFGHIEYVKRTPLRLPANCHGLKKEDVKTEAKQVPVNGRLVPQYTMRLGTVILDHDVRKDGSIHSPHVFSSTHSCFEANAKAAIVQWRAESQEFKTKDAAVKLHFVISGATLNELNSQLNDFLQ